MRLLPDAYPFDPASFPTLIFSMFLTLPVSDRAGSASQRAVRTSAAKWIPLVVAIVSLFSGPASADPLSTPPLGGEEHGQFFESLQLLDPATAALPPLPARVPATPLQLDDEATTKLPPGLTADSWMWELTADSLSLPQQGPPPVREVPPLTGWARIVAKATAALLAAGAVMALAVLMSLTQRR